MKPSGRNDTYILINPKTLSVCGIDTNAKENYGIEFCEWKDWLSFLIKYEHLECIGKESFIAHCIVTMTSNGFEEETIKQSLEYTKNELSENISASLNLDEHINKDITIENIVDRGKEIKIELFREKEVPQVGPWVRFWARAIDGILFSTAIFIAKPYFNPYLAFLYKQNFLFVPIMLVLIEAILLSTWGTTIGKWFLKVLVRDESGNKLTINKSLYRSLFVWIIGEGGNFNILLTPLANLVSYVIIQRDGKTLWDQRGGFLVKHEKIGMARIFIAVATIMGVYLLLWFQVIKRVNY